MASAEPDPAFEELLRYVKEARGFDFTGYKRPSLQRRVDKRMQALRIDGYGAYLTYLDAHDDEFADLFDTILINVTGFFRDPAAWTYLQDEVVPRIAEARAGKDIRVWSTGCSSGEEAYTLAMVVAEALGEEALRDRVKIYATDVDQDALSEGRHALYEPERLQGVPEELRSRYFERLDGRFAFRADLRRTVVFGRHDLVQDPPISRIDLLSARNTLMYFTPEAQTRVLRSFHFALRDTGYLFLGRSEMLMTRTTLFQPSDLRRRVFVKTDRSAQPDERPPAVGTPAPAQSIDELATEALMRQAGFEAAPTAQVVVDREGTLVLANVQARILFGLSQRDIGRPFQDLEISYRPVELRSRIEQAYEARHTISLRDVEWQLPSGEVRFVDVQVVPLVPPGSAPVGVGMTVTDVTRYRLLQQALDASKREAESAFEDLQSVNEELETTNEELQSTNEELETTNEELQSTNEELETMNEELQSTNEELVAINDELNRRTDDLNVANAFQRSVLSAIDAGVVALDDDLRITSWSDGAVELFGLRSDEAVGQHFLNLEIGLPVDELRKPIRRCMADGAHHELELRAVNRLGKQLVLRAVVTPLVDVGRRFARHDPAPGARRGRRMSSRSPAADTENAGARAGGARPGRRDGGGRRPGAAAGLARGAADDAGGAARRRGAAAAAERGPRRRAPRARRGARALRGALPVRARRLRAHRRARRRARGERERRQAARRPPALPARQAARRLPRPRQPGRLPRAAAVDRGRDGTVAARPAPAAAKRHPLRRAS